jgi:hypothetical protein
VLDALTVSDFEPLVGEVFALEDESAGALEFELIEARAIDRDAPAVDHDGIRTPFRLMFRGPGERALPQRIYRLRHDALGAMEIFIVPVGRDAGGVHYEAIFA